MNTLVIILGIVLVFFVYLLFKYLTNTASTLNSAADFTKAIPAITGDALPAPTNLSYAHGVWLYVQNWDPTVQKTIFYRPNNIKLYLDPQSPTLYCDVTLDDDTAKTVMVTNSFPLQKWVYIIISVDNQFLDCYLDGKLVISQQVMKTKTENNRNIVIAPKQPVDATASPLYLGNSGNPIGGTFTSGTPGASVGPGWSANALIFTRWTTPVDPQTAWDWYMKGNGRSKFNSLFGSYGVNYSVLKDNIVVINNQPLF